jgi:hypothetical protein
MEVVDEIVGDQMAIFMIATVLYVLQSLTRQGYNHSCVAVSFGSNTVYTYARCDKNCLRIFLYGTTNDRIAMLHEK